MATPFCQQFWRSLLFLISLLHMLQSLHGQSLSPSDYPTEIRLRAGVLHAPPFALVEGQQDGGKQLFQFGGFQVDLLDRLKVFASEDGVNLSFELSKAPGTYAEAFDWVANDCNTTVVNNPNLLKDCQSFDLIVGDYYSNPTRHMRANLSPPWLKTTATTIKHVEKAAGEPDYTTLAEAQDAQATVCVPAGTFIRQVIMEKFPRANYLDCMIHSECIQRLKDGDCVLLADDELLLHWKAADDPSLKVVGEAYNTQYIVWPLRHDIDWKHAKLLNKWLYTAVKNATIDELFFKYFKKELCPLGTAGEECELPCDPNHGKANARGECICVSPRWKGEDCSEEVPEDLNLLPSNLVIVGYTLVGISFALSILCGAWLIHNRSRSQVRFAQPLFLFLILLGCLISTSTILALAQEDGKNGENVPACMAIPWLYSAGFSITFGALFARIRRVYTLLESAMEMRRVTVSNQETLLTVVLVLALDVCILITWTVVDPLRWEREVTLETQFREPLESEGYCISDHWVVFTSVIAAYHVVLMAIACYMCYLTRQIPDKLTGNKYVEIAMFSNLQILIVVLPVLIILGSDPQGSFFVRSMAIWINDIVVVLVIFGGLIYQVHTWDRNNLCDGRSSEAVIAENIAGYAQSASNAESRFSSGASLYSHSKRPSTGSIMGLSSHSSDEEIMHKEEGAKDSNTKLPNTTLNTTSLATVPTPAVVENENPLEQDAEPPPNDSQQQSGMPIDDMEKSPAVISEPLWVPAVESGMEKLPQNVKIGSTQLPDLRDFPMHTHSDQDSLAPGSSIACDGYTAKADSSKGIQTFSPISTPNQNHPPEKTVYPHTQNVGSSDHG